jgi:hypothetical protein
MSKNKKYETVIRGKWVYGKAETFDEMIDALKSEIRLLEEMRDSGCKLCADGADDDYFFVTTKSKTVAEKFGIGEV